MSVVEPLAGAAVGAKRERRKITVEIAITGKTVSVASASRQSNTISTMADADERDGVLESVVGPSVTAELSASRRL